MLQISVPTLLLDTLKAKRNISGMLNRAKNAGVALRPHFKTHQSAVIGEWFRDLGIKSIAVSNLRMAEKFAASDWTDILVAIPVNTLEIERINTLSERVNLGLAVDCDLPVAMLKRDLKNEVDIYIEIDTGYHRTGILWDNSSSIDRTIERIQNCNLMNFKGFMVHAGQTYKVNTGSLEGNREMILSIHKESMGHLQTLRAKYSSIFPDLQISYGDTPSCSLAEEFGPVTEIRPGNFVFYDLTMVKLGVCQENEIAVAMACPVIGINHKRHEVAIYGGGIHFSKEFLSHEGDLIYGKMVQSYSRGWGDSIPNATIKGLSQEHGIVKIENSLAFRRIGVSDVLMFLPVHSCLTVDCMKSYLTCEGERINI